VEGPATASETRR